MYLKKDRETGNLFSELFPFGGKLNEKNQWFKLSKIIPWDKMDRVYAKYFSEIGRPAKDSRRVTGLLIVKHRKSYSDRDLIDEFSENIYVQYFCGYEQFISGKEINYSTLCKLRKRLGKEYFKSFEKELIEILVKEKVLRPKELMLDATVCPSDITYPTDIKLLNVVREWLCDKINYIRRKAEIKEKVRTYRRVARKLYLSCQKKRRKSKKMILKAKKKLIRYVRRNLKQFETIFLKASGKLKLKIKEELENRLKVARKIYEQQKEMVEKKVNKIKDRIVSFHLPEVRPIVRGKDGKKVEFGPKVVLSYVDGFGFLDKISFDAYNESTELKNSLNTFKERFDKAPDCVTTDRIFGTRENRRLLHALDIEDNFIPLGRSSPDKSKQKRIKKAQKRRNRIEGMIGTGKCKYKLERVRYRI
ncbi:IS5 family transposase, partial [candidate division WOR-3 bacterium]|nr:IS5 family transposase [candidate division WOR-3 bacterium]